MEKLISIITINYNNLKDTIRFLRSIEKINPRNVEIIVVDNGSRKDISPIMKTYFPEVKVVRSESNLGFAGGNNLGTAAASGDVIYYVNNDTYFLEDHFQTLADRLIENPEIGAVSPQLIYPDGRIQFQGKTEINPFTGRTRDLTPNRKGLVPTAYIHGGAVMTSRKVLEKAGLMPENYFLYYEELSWAEQMKAAGFRLYIDMDHEIVHDESSTTSKISDLKTYFMTRNRLLFMRSHAHQSILLFVLYYLFFALPKSLFGLLLKKEYKNILASLAGIWWHVTHRCDSQQLGYKFDHLAHTVS